MIEGRTILCFASGYDAPPTSKHHVMHLLAEKNTVLWVNYHASRAPSASASDMGHIARKLREVFAGLKRPRPNLYVLTPLVVPLPASKLARKINREMLVMQIRRALRKVRGGPVQLWSFTPDVGYMLKLFGEEKVLYYCVDDHASFTGYNRRQVLADEQQLCEAADLVVTTSLALQEAKEPWNPRTMLVPHGVDYPHFRGAVDGDLPAPPDVADIPHPRLGFFGLIRDWVDLDMLARVAAKRPEWHFVLIGDADSNVNLGQYRDRANMHMLGRKPYQELPAYCKAFDVGLIPFKINDLTLAVNPIKLREYLAAGLPVISSPMPEVKLYEHLIELAETPEQFEAAAEKCLALGPDKRLALADAMRDETWPGKVDQICEALMAPGQALAGKPAAGTDASGREESPR